MALEAELANIVNTDILVVKLIAIAITIVVAAILILIPRKILRKHFTHQNTNKFSGAQITSAQVIYSVFRFVILAFAIIVILDIAGVNITGFVAGLGIVGAIAALAVQDLIKDLIAGTNIVSEQYFAIGDVIECKGYTGTVISLTMKSTKIKTYNGSIVTLQNHLIDSARLVSTENKATVSLSYDLDRAKAFSVLEEIVAQANNLPTITNAVFAGISSFEDSSIDYAIVYNCDPALAPMVLRQLNGVIIDVLDREGISIPYNQLDIHQK